jgi:cytochrome c553
MRGGRWLERRGWLVALGALLLCGANGPIAAAPPDAADHFERKVRPLLLARCVSCHGPDKAKGRLRLDTAAGLARGGASGPPVRPGRPDESLLVRAVRHDGDIKMPPNKKLKSQEIDDLALWVKAGAVWPEAKPLAGTKAAQPARSLEPNAPALRKHLQAWYRADRLSLAEGDAVHVWPDSSGHGRDLAATKGVRTGGVGAAPSFVKAGTVYRRPAVRFAVASGMASSPDLPVDVRGDAGLTIVLVMNLLPHDAQPPYDGVVGLGNPANPTGDPGRPLAALVQISRPGGGELQLAGGWNHDATLGPGSFRPLFGRPLLLTVVKKPGPMRTSTRFYLNGVRSDDRSINRPVGGRSTVPDIRHRDDIGLYLGKALPWCGSIRGDVSEVLVYNAPLGEDERAGVEMALSERYGFVHPSTLAESKATFTAEQKRFWAFGPVKAVTPPGVKDPAWARTPVDRFILASLEASGLRPAPQADRRTLLRRATFDLIGLPPTPEEIDAFLRDGRPDAWERVIDRLLSSPAYGERWGRHWLDVARYAETTANDSNAVMRYAWRYRDYVVRAFNADLPYDQFVTEQLAGDLLPHTGDPARDADRVIATGFLMVGPKALAETDIEGSRMDIVDDQIDTTGRALLGVTISCARCHDHKFDPIPAVDYYSLAGIFRGTEVFRDEARGQVMWQEWPLSVPAGTKPVTVMAPKEGKATTLHVALRGDRQMPGVLAPRRFLQIVAGEGHAPIVTSQSGRLELARWIASADNPLTSRVLVNRVWQHHFGTGLVATSDNFGARGERPSHPELLDWLSAELVRGGWSIKRLHRLLLLSATYQTDSRGSAALREADPDNRLLGRTSRRRLDAEGLRDALLAVSGQLDRTLGGDESGELLFREGEVINKARDFFRPNRVKADHPIYTQSARRSIYLPVVRNAIPGVLALFDGADPNAVSAVRNDTTVASQALFLLNHPFVREQALHLVRRLLAGPKGSDAGRVTEGYRLALGRKPRTDEVEDVVAFLAAYEKRAAEMGRSPEEARLRAWQSFCQTLLCRNEMLYVD